MCSVLDEPIPTRLDRLRRGERCYPNIARATERPGCAVRPPTMHDESAGVPMIMAGPDIPEGRACETLVSLVDIYPTILDGAGVPKGSSDEELPGRSLMRIAAAPDDADRIVFGEYHAAGAISGVYMLRTDRYKYLHYAGGYDPELYDMEADPEELHNVAADPGHSGTLNGLKEDLLKMIDPEEINEKALSDQARLIERHGGRGAVIARGAANNTPVPGEELVIVR